MSSSSGRGGSRKTKKSVKTLSRIADETSKEMIAA